MKGNWAVQTTENLLNKGDLREWRDNEMVFWLKVDGPVENSLSEKEVPFDLYCTARRVKTIFQSKDRLLWPITVHFDQTNRPLPSSTINVDANDRPIWLKAAQMTLV